MLLPRLVIEEGLLFRALGQSLPGDRGGVSLPTAVEDHHLQGGQGGPGIPVGKGGDGLQHGRFHCHLLVPKAPRVGEGPLEQDHQVLLGQGLEDEHFAPGEQRTVDLKGGILRGGPDEKDAPFLHKGEKGVLLGLVEAVDLVHEDDGPFPELPVALGLLHHRADLLDPAGDGGKVDEFRLCGVGDDPGQGGLSHPRWPPEDHGRDLVPFDQLAKDLSRPQQMLLPDVLCQRARAEPGGQGLGVLPCK